MSVRVMSMVWDNFNRGGSEKLAMLALADWCNDQGGSLHPSVATVARKINLTEKQARVILHRLIDEGWLAVIGNEFGGNPGQSRQYRLNVEMLSTPPVDGFITDEQKLRQKVFERTNGTCAYCQTELGDNWHIDHVIPRSRGGKDCLSNLVPSCGKCNAEKGNMLLDEWKQTPPVDVTPPAEVTPPVEVRDPSRGGSFTPPVGGSLSTIEPPIDPPIKYNPRAYLLDAGVDEGITTDFLALRAKLKAPVTKTAIAGIEREAAKAGYTLERALQTCCERSWRGFSAAWVSDSQQGARPKTPRPESFEIRQYGQGGKL